MGFSLDKDKALESFLRKYRSERDKKFQQLDVDFMKALERDDVDTKTSITSQKIMLRDFPSSITTDLFETKDELRELWPVELLELPTSWY